MSNNGTAATTEAPSSPVSLPTSEPPSSDPPSSTEAPPPSSSAPPPTSVTPSPSSSEAAPSSSAAPSSPPAASATSIVTAHTTTPTETEVVTSVVTPSPTNPTQTPDPVTVVHTIVKSNSANQATSSASAPTSSATDPSDPALAKPGSKQASNGLSPAGKTAIAVVIPVVVVALLLLAGIWFWRKRKSRKNAEEARRKEVEEYGFNPNEDPTLPAVGMQSEMAEDQSGYRGWGNTTTSSNRKASTTLTSGMTYSDSNSNPGDVNYANPGSPTHAYSDAHSGDPLVNGRRETLDSDGIGALGTAPASGQNQGVARGPSNASSSYSAADRSDNSGDYPLPMNNPQEYYENTGYYQSGPYDNGYGGNQQPIIRDVSARRNTRIENPSVFPQQGNSGIAQNF